MQALQGQGAQMDCHAIIKEALETRRLTPGLASKLAGKLAWGGAHLFHRIGRAMLRPIFDQRSRRDGQVGTELQRALEWWLLVLDSGIAEERRWGAPSGDVSHLFCDARGYPPHLAAVLFHDGVCSFTHMEPPSEVMSQFTRRSDNQIMGLELPAVSLGLSTFETALRGLKVVVHSDNSGSEVKFFYKNTVLG